jgi:hypothetical protein
MLILFSRFVRARTQSSPLPYGHLYILTRGHQCVLAPYDLSKGSSMVDSWFVFLS